MRFTSLPLAALSVSVALGLCMAGCSEERAASSYHPTPAAWYGSNTTSTGTQAQAPITQPADEPGTTRATANVGGTGGGPTDGTDVKGMHRGHLNATTGTADTATKAVSRTGK